MNKEIIGNNQNNSEILSELKQTLILLRKARIHKKIRELRLKISKLSEVLIKENKTLLPALKSNYIAFEIFSFFRQPEA